MRRFRIALLSLVLSGCSGAPSDPGPLAGAWDVTLRPGRLPLPFPNGAPVARARVVVQRDTQFLNACTRRGAGECREDGMRITDAATGTFEIDAEAGFPRVHTRGEVQLVSDGGGRLHLVMGPCCDAGAIHAKGSLNGSRGAGTWYQQFLREGPPGRYLIERSTDSSRIAHSRGSNGGDPNHRGLQRAVR